MENNSNAQPSAPVSAPAKKNSKIILGCFGCLFLLLIAMAIIGVVVFKKVFRKKSFEPARVPSPAAIELDKEREVSKTITAAGGVLTTQGADGTLYSLTVPPESVILPTSVTLTPLKSAPVENFNALSDGKGVYVGPQGKSGMTFIRPAFLVIKPGGELPQKGQTGAASWGRCNIGSRGFDPQVCAGIHRKLPFGLGVDPGKVVVFSKEASDRNSAQLLLTPTVPIGEKDTFVAEIQETGSYIGDRLNREDLAAFLIPTLEGPSDYINKPELLVHYAALGGDLRPYKEHIRMIGSGKRDYPREVLKGGIVALFAGDKEAADKRIEAANITLERNLSRARGSFLPWPRYYAFLMQIEIEEPQDQNTLGLVKTALAQDDASDEENSDNTLDIRALLEIARTLRGRIEAERIRQNTLTLAAKVILDRNAFVGERADAFEVMATADTKPTPPPTSPPSDPDDDPDDGPVFGGPHRDPDDNTDSGGDDDSSEPEDPPTGTEPETPPTPEPGTGPSGGGNSGTSSDYGGFAEKCALIVQNIPKCTTLECVEHLWDMAKQYNCVGADEPAGKRINDLLANVKNCGDLVHKDLSNYGMNECEGEDAGAGSAPINPDADGDGLPDLAPLPGAKP